MATVGAPVGDSPGKSDESGFNSHESAECLLLPDMTMTTSRTLPTWPVRHSGYKPLKTEGRNQSRAATSYQPLPLAMKCAVEPRPPDTPDGQRPRAVSCDSPLSPRSHRPRSAFRLIEEEDDATPRRGQSESVLAASDTRRSQLRRMGSCDGMRHMMTGSKMGSAISQATAFSRLPTSASGFDRQLSHEELASRSMQVSEFESLQAKDEGVSIFTIISGIALCANTVIGAGTLAVPFTMSLVGVALYHLLIAAVLFANFISLRWLVQVADALPEGVPRSYEGIAHIYIGTEADIAISAALLFGGFALTMAYLLFITTTLTSVLAGPLIHWGMPAGDIEKSILFGVGFFVVLPLLMLRDISKLRYTSAFAICALFATAAYVIASGWIYVAHEGIHEGVVAARCDCGIFQAIPMTVSAFCCHLLVIPIYDSLGPARTPAVMDKVMAAALFLAFVVYEVVGIMGYLHFGGAVHGNILQSLAQECGVGPLTATVSICMALTLICHVPCVVWPLRSVIISAYGYLVVGFKEMREEPSALEWQGASVFIMVGVLGMVTLMPSVKTALSMVGSIGGAFIVFLYPAAFHLAVVKGLKDKSSWLSSSNIQELVMMGTGIVVGGVCLSMSIYNGMNE